MLREINVNELYPHPQNPRKDVGDVSELADSIKNQGIFQNLTVVKGGAGVPEETEGYTVIIGHRRLAAAKLAGIKTVPCSVVEMDEKQQVATMLLENMQRTDLTVYEQAQGFQMMLDLGETQKSIAEKTGFSPATVSQRLQLTKLDQEILQDVAARQISIVELNKLNKIDSIEERNKLLKFIGTSNFEWNVTNALRRQETDNKVKIWKDTLLSSGLIEIDDHWDNKYESCKRSYFTVDANPEEFVRADDEKYFKISYGSVYMRKDREERVKTEAEEAEERRLAQLNDRRNALSAASKLAFEMRKKFAENVSNATAKKHFTDIIAYWMYRQTIDSSYSYEDQVIDLLGVEFTEEDDGDVIRFEDVYDAVKDCPEKRLWQIVYLFADDSSDNNYFERWNNVAHKENESLDDLYHILVKLGYQMSDEEKQLQDGTHKFFGE